ncbi:hypothetical protein GRF61_07205 [Azoarcus sp. TTM-91]|uniref:hypothetical protein n=1 Tax=Azoarcus sp. TTM-91 TaxID=2691581 RepID=UPI00145E72B8|nr:hypothetical protein [Azoarcus sp. TTM-91]NMG34231.1 hypothetical protein [Azoarcus sp. TTM-91]
MILAIRKNTTHLVYAALLILNIFQYGFVMTAAARNDLSSFGEDEISKALKRSMKLAYGFDGLDVGKLKKEITEIFLGKNGNLVWRELERSGRCAFVTGFQKDEIQCDVDKRWSLINIGPPGFGYLSNSPLESWPEPGARVLMNMILDQEDVKEIKIDVIDITSRKEVL